MSVMGKCNSEECRACDDCEEAIQQLKRDRDRYARLLASIQAKAEVIANRGEVEVLVERADYSPF